MEQRIFVKLPMAEEFDPYRYRSEPRFQAILNKDRLAPKRSHFRSPSFLVLPSL